MPDRQMGYVRKGLLLIISIAIIVVGLGMAAFGLLGDRILFLFVAGGPVLAFFGLYLLWEDFIAPMFRREDAP